MTTNSSYLNPRGSPGSLRILCARTESARALFDAWEGKSATVEPEHFKTRPLLLLNVYATGITVVTSPQGTEIGYADAAGGFEARATLADPPGGIQILGSPEIEFAESPDEDNTREPNLIISVEPLGKDAVLPVFAGQVSYAAVTDGLAPE
jgi:hypothetical protein